MDNMSVREESGNVSTESALHMIRRMSKNEFKKKN